MGKVLKNKSALVTGGKRHRANAELQPQEPLSAAQAVSALKKYKATKFDQTVDCVIVLGIDPKQADQIIRGSIVLPHGIGKTQRVVVFAKGEMAEAAIFRTMASYAPAFGMVGTLLGLINLMDLVGAGDLGAIGRQLAVALMTTFYGVLLANLVFKPIALKLERRTEERLVLMNMVLEGISMMCAGRSPSMMRETLKAFVAQFDDEMFDGGSQGAKVRKAA